MSDKETTENPQPEENIELPTNEIVQNDDNSPNPSRPEPPQSKED